MTTSWNQSTGSFFPDEHPQLDGPWRITGGGTRSALLRVGGLCVVSGSRFPRCIRGGRTRSRRRGNGSRKGFLGCSRAQNVKSSPGPQPLLRVGAWESPLSVASMAFGGQEALEHLRGQHTGFRSFRVGVRGLGASDGESGDHRQTATDGGHLGEVPGRETAMAARRCGTPVVRAPPPVSRC